jgi:hypothetical protein
MRAEAAKARGARLRIIRDRMTRRSMQRLTTVRATAGSPGQARARSGFGTRLRVEEISIGLEPKTEAADLVGPSPPKAASVMRRQQIVDGGLAAVLEVGNRTGPRCGQPIRSSGAGALLLVLAGPNTLRGTGASLVGLARGPAAAPKRPPKKTRMRLVPPPGGVDYGDPARARRRHSHARSEPGDST